ncbi:hypothetical protein ACFL5X_03960 [Candidatus Omnitrophota bacterium]
MNRILSLTIKGQTVTGIELAKKGASLSLAAFISDKKALTAKAKALPTVAALQAPVFIKSLRLRKEQLRTKRTIQEFILHKPPFPLKDSRWDYSTSGAILTLFVTKTKDVDNALGLFDSLNVAPTFVTSKAACLYNYFMFHKPKQKDGFCLLYFAKDFLNMLTFAKGRFFFYEIPFNVGAKDPQALKSALQEFTRQREYLQFQESIPAEYLASAFVCGQADAELVEKLSQGLGATVELITPAVASRKKDAELLAESADQLPILIGAGLLALQKGALSIDFIKEQRHQNLLTAYKDRLMGLATFVSVVIMLGLAGASVFLLNDMIANRRTLRSHEKIVKMLTPVYTELDAKNKELLGYIEPLEKHVLEHTFFVEAMPIVDKLRGKVDVTGFSFTRGEELELDLDVKAPAYDDISAFLKRLRENEYFSKIVPVSSRSAAREAETGEVIYFKIKLVR